MRRGPRSLSLQRAVVDRLHEQLLDEPRARCDAAVAEQRDVLLAQRQQARGLDAGDRRRALQPLGQRLGLGVRVVEQALGDRGAPAAAAALQPHVVARGVEQLDRGAADAGLGEGREGVREEDDLAAADRAARPLVGPADQRLALEARQRAPPVDPRDLLQQPPRDRQVRERRGRGAERVERPDRAEQPRAPRRAVDRVVVREELGLHRRHVDAQRALALARLALEAEIEDLVQALVAQRGARGRARPAPSRARSRARGSRAPPRVSPCRTGT